MQFNTIILVCSICAKEKKVSPSLILWGFPVFSIFSDNLIFAYKKAHPLRTSQFRRHTPFSLSQANIFCLNRTKSFRLPYAAFFFVKIARTGKPISTRMIPPTATFLASAPAINSWFSRTYRPETIAMMGITGYAGTL